MLIKTTKKLLAAAFGARQKYLSYLLERKVEQKNEDKKKKVLSDKINILKTNKPDQHLLLMT